MVTPAIITLTSIPPRFGLLGPCLASLLRQDLPAREIQLWLPPHYRRFPDWDGSLPALPPGIRLMRAELDWGPATKVLGAVQALRGQAVDLLFCDDDRIYPPGWHRAFCALRAVRPDDALAAQAIHLPGLGTLERGPARSPRMRRWTAAERAADPARREYAASGYADQVEGWAGVMVRPDFFTPHVFDIPPVLWTVDDTWLSGDLERAGRAIWFDLGLLRPASHQAARHVEGLLETRIEGHTRIEAETAAIAWFRNTCGIWRKPRVHPLRRMMRRVLPHDLRQRLRRRFPWLSVWRA